MGKQNFKRLLENGNISFVSAFEFVAFASTAGGLRTFFGAAFASFKKYAAHFLNSAFGETEPNEAPPKVLVITRVINSSFIF